MTSAIIVGAGIAGTVAAVALRRAGIDAAVHEAREPGAEEAGAFLTLAPNGLDALAAVGLDDAVRSLGFETPRMELATADGRRITAFTTGTGRDGTASRTLRRADLHAALRREAVRTGAAFTHGHRLVGTAPTARGVRATFADGSTAEADLLLGADGIGSRTRSLLDPGAPSPRYTGSLNVAGVAEEVPAGVDPRPGTLHLAFGRRCFTGWTTAPDGRVWWFANPPSRREPDRAELAALDGSEWRARLLDLLAGDRGPAAEIVRASADVQPGWATHDLPRVPRWHDGRTVLLGDAAHAASPSSGQGASLAAEDAVVLAMCLRDLPLPAALDAYEGLRRRRTERIVAEARRTTRSKAAGPVGRFVRDRVVLPLVGRSAARAGEGSLTAVHRHHLDWDQRVAPAVGERVRASA